jgi:hypothetical protein
MLDSCEKIGGEWGEIGSKMMKKLKKSAHGEP